MTKKKATKQSGKRETEHISHSMAHYLLAVHKLKETKGYARVTDVARELNISKGSVSTTLTGLKNRGFIAEEEGSKFLALTDYGHNEVHHILSSRALLFHFFHDLLGVENSAAREGSCLMEHLMSDDIRERFFEFMKTISLPGKDPQKKALMKSINGFETGLDLNQYETLAEFIDDQEPHY